MGLLDGRVVIVTGAGGGIGREHALAFAAEGIADEALFCMRRATRGCVPGLGGEVSGR